MQLPQVIPLILMLALTLNANVHAADLSCTAAEMDDVTILDVKHGAPKVETLQTGGTALRFDEPFSFRVDLKSRDIEPRKFDLIKLEVKADRAAFLRVAVENHPRPGDISYWYVLDGMRGAFDWKTIWVDLKVPEEIKARGDHRSPWREGIAGDETNQRGVRIEGSVRDLKSRRQGSERRIWIGKVRFVKEAVHLDWDQTKAIYSWGKGQDLVYTYPLTIHNELNQPVTARIAFQPIETRHARATVDNQAVPLEAGQTRTIEARIGLPASVAAKQEPLYCERFLVTAKAENIDDSTVTVLRSSDPIHLTVTVPLDEGDLELPLFPRPSKLPASVVKFDQDLAQKHASHNPRTLIENAMHRGLYQYGYAKDVHNVGQYRQTLISAAYLYDLNGEGKHLRTARQLLQALPEIWNKWYCKHEQQPVRIISSGIVARWNDRSHYTLGLGWLVMGTQRSPYYYGVSGNGAGGSMGALAYAFDIISPQLDETARQRIIEGFFLPVGIQCRNHYIGDGNQQMTADVAAIYAGILARNWPLVSFGYSSEHGLQAVLDECFDDDGVQLRKNYQTYTMRPIFWAGEMFSGAGLNVYDKHRRRLTQIISADTVAKGQGAPFQDVEFWQFVKDKRLR